jgi:hypothetical protein
MEKAYVRPDESRRDERNFSTVQFSSLPSSFGFVSLFSLSLGIRFRNYDQHMSTAASYMVEPLLKRQRDGHMQRLLMINSNGKSRASSRMSTHLFCKELKNGIRG